MSYKHLVVDQLKLSHEGLFDVKGVYQVIEQFFYENNWDKRETVNQELVTPEGRQIKLVLNPWKSISDYSKLIIRIKLFFHNIKDVEIDKDGQKIKINQGEIKIIFDGYVLDDRLHWWDSQPFTWFIDVLFQKYLFKEQYNMRERWLLSYVDELYKQVKYYLGMYSYEQSTQPDQEMRGLKF